MIERRWICIGDAQPMRRWTDLSEGTGNGIIFYATVVGVVIFRAATGLTTTDTRSVLYRCAELGHWYSDLLSNSRRPVTGASWVRLNLCSFEGALSAKRFSAH